MIEIPLTRGLVAFVSDEDAHLTSFKWYAHKAASGFYAARQTPGPKGPGGHLSQVRVFLHKVILGIGPGVQGDHINGNTLDCQRSNLRPVHHAQNAKNRKGVAGSLSGLKGVWRSPSKNKTKPWQATITSNGKRQYLGLFRTPQEAAHAYDKAALELHGEYARLNFPEEKTHV